MADGESVVVIAEEDGSIYAGLSTGSARIAIMSCDEAVTMMGYGGVGLLLLDCGHAAERGLSMLSGLKQAFPYVPIIFVTDVTKEEVAITAFKAGARDYFKKPVSLHEIEQSVVNLLRLRQTCTERRQSLRQFCNSLQENRDPDGRIRECHPPPGLARAICAMHQHSSWVLRLDLVAKEAGMSKYHFCRVFKKHYGMSPMHFLCRLRVEQAKQLLEKSPVAVSSVAFSVGFNDISEFNRQFKKVTGVSPSTYRSTGSSIEGASPSLGIAVPRIYCPQHLVSFAPENPPRAEPCRREVLPQT